MCVCLRAHVHACTCVCCVRVRWGWKRHLWRCLKGFLAKYCVIFQTGRDMTIFPKHERLDEFQVWKYVKGLCFLLAILHHPPKYGLGNFFTSRCICRSPPALT